MAAVGTLGMIMNTSKSAGDTKLRMEAAELAEDIVGRMQGDMGLAPVALANISTYDDAFAGAAPGNKTQWKANVAASLPAGVGGIVVDNTFAGGTGALVTITINWTVPGNTTQDRTRKYTLTTALAANQ